MTTGRGWGILILAEGSTDQLNTDDWAWLEQIAGVIVASGDHDSPLIYGSEAELIRAWKELHSISGLRISAEDEERLEMLDAEDGDED